MSDELRALAPEDEATLRRLAFDADSSRLRFTPSEVRLLLATLDAARAASQGDEWLRVGRLTRALFAAMGWPTRRVPASSDDEGGGVGPFPAGLQTGDPDNPAWTELAEQIAREYAALAAEEERG